MEASTCSLKWPTIAITTTPASNLQEVTHRASNQSNRVTQIFCFTITHRQTHTLAPLHTNCTTNLPSISPTYSITHVSLYVLLYFQIFSILVTYVYVSMYICPTPSHNFQQQSVMTPSIPATCSLQLKLYEMAGYSSACRS